MVQFRRLRVVPVLCLGATLGLTACGGTDVARTFGLVRDAPDEFQVTTRAPLSMPPDYTLRPPRPGASRPQEQSSSSAAQATLAPQTAFGADAVGSTSPGQQALLNASGPAAPADIRRKVDADAAIDAPGPSFTDRLMFWRSPPPPGIVVDPQKEAQRLRENAALGQNVQQGDTPIIQPKKQSLFGRIF
ncbi:DUF3035 domain-containing protein [Limobrevibacterium gyesilva]|uniref:DUF3035 domain-containing protein n=1 Tax=Limobrevibacterium gyesilva TaxID=2991712 RepID=A0AA42CEC1_9PROT|nr:DUF3035 domain-containing protein [Limobrevibacterium gyesilva]MCW3473326.1 DUF3035 domain-containing protein [Limobrevibacterium gyesilva]